jgi:hypothetical protein
MGRAQNAVARGELAGDRPEEGPKQQTGQPNCGSRHHCGQHFRCVDCKAEEGALRTLAS